MRQWLAMFAVLVAAAAPVAARADDTSAKDSAFAVHLQFTDVVQAHPAFTSPFRGPNSLDPAARADATNDLTAYVGFRPWAGGEIWVDSEADQGFGLSDTLGLAAFSSGEAYKVGANAPYFKFQRAFLRQTFALGGGNRDVDADLNQLAGHSTNDRVVLTIGKFSVPDIFDANTYAHDARGDFMNWTVIDGGAFDYAADAWGYTYGAAAELYTGPWTARIGAFALTDIPNSPHIDTSFGQFQLIGEAERRFELAGRSGTVRLTGFLSRARMGHYGDAVALAEASGTRPDMASVRRYSSRGGVGLNGELAVTKTVGVFLRASYAGGDSEAFEFTDVDRSVSAGVSISGAAWRREDDTVGLGAFDNALSGHGRAYLAAGGLGILVGDGRLPRSGDETGLETYYSLAVGPVAHVSLDYQFVANPAYDRLRGPASIFGLRVHLAH